MTTFGHKQHQKRFFGVLTPCTGALTPALLLLPLVPLVPQGRQGATVEDRWLLGVQIAAIPAEIIAFLGVILAPVAL